VRLPVVGERLNPGGDTSGAWYQWFARVDRTLFGTTSDADETPATPATVVNQGIGIQVTGSSENGYSVALRPLADSGTGAFKLITRDAFGRISGSADGDAADVPYDNATSGLTATDTQAAIDEVKALIGASGVDIRFIWAFD
jgi:hypothetical protein